MATRVGNPGQGAAATPRAPAVTSQQSADLKNAGLTSGKTPTQAAKGVVSGLKARGFSAPGASLGQQLSAALGAFQQAMGLPVTGRLDAATVKALKALGVIAGAQAGVGAGKSAFEGKAGRDGTALGEGAPKGALTAQGKADTGQRTLKSVLAGLTAAAGGGSAAAQKALDAILNKNPGANAGQPPPDPATTTPGQVGGGAADTAASAAMQNGAHHATYVDGAGRLSAGLAREGAPTEQARSRAGEQDATERGIEGDDDGEKGRDDEETGAEGGDGGEGGGPLADGAHDGGSREGDAAGTERHVGNTYSGDFNTRDKRRGHARYDDGTFSKPGYYEVPALSAQIRDALDTLARAPDAKNRAAHYIWDAMFCRPGVYSAGQAAPELLHLVVPEAEAFDVVWTDAVDALNKRLKRIEPGAKPLTVDEMRKALFRARYA